MSKPVVSVLMSAYNAAPFVRAAIDSILAQTFQDLELVVVDDGSTDQTPRVLAEIDDPRVRLLRQDNAGQAKGRNTGLEVAQGEFVTFLDADDLCDPTRVEKQLAFLRAHPDIYGVGTWEVVVDRDGNPLEYPTLPCEPEQIRRAYAEGRMALNGMSVMVRAEVFDVVGRFREALALCQDMDMWMRVTERFDVACLPEPLYIYRRHSGAVSHTRSARQRFFARLVLDLRQERLTSGTDRLDRGVPIEVPTFSEEPGSVSYRRAVAWYHAERSRRLAHQSRWGPALRSAATSWRINPSDPWQLSFLGRTLVAALFPFARVHSPRAALRSLLVGRGNGSPIRPRVDKSDQPSSAQPDTLAVRLPLTSTLVRDIHTLEAISQQWDALLAESDTPQAFFSSSTCNVPFWHGYGKQRELAVVLVRDGHGELVGAAPFYAETTGRWLSRHRRLALLGSPESGADYLDILTRPGWRQAVLGETFRCLERERVRWDVLYLDYILDDSNTTSLLATRSLPHRFWIHKRPSSVCPYFDLPPTWDQFRKGLGKSTRNNMRHKLNVLRRQFRDVRFECVGDERRIPQLIRTMLQYKQAKYGHRFDYEYVAWIDQALAALHKGQLRLWVLWVDDQPACISLCFAFAGRMFTQAEAYHPDYGRLGVGFLLSAHMYHAAIDEGARVWDLKRGDAPHKRVWTSSARHTVQVHAVRHSAWGAWVDFWEYGDLMARVRHVECDAYYALRRAGRNVLEPIARRCPAVVPKPIRRRLLRPPGGQSAQLANHT
ncbi:MAG TPA: GNAT family N-acetyltransferase [Phycisphaerae bacterium]|nr:GNAT family N-acetyltransferase [Phycisphaerae bacterium]